MFVSAASHPGLERTPRRTNLSLSVLLILFFHLQNTNDIVSITFFFFVLKINLKNDWKT